MNWPLSYEEAFGCWLNHDEAMKRRAATVALGVTALLSAEVSTELKDAV